MNQLTPDETILGLLAAEARHGYQLLDVFQDAAQLGLVWDLSTSQLYAVLKRLHKQALITGQEIASLDAPTRIEYVLTEAGIHHLKSWLNVERPSASIHCVRVEFLSRLYIARLLNVPTRAIIHQQKLACQDEIDILTARRDLSRPGIGYLTLELVIAQLYAILDWIDRCELVPKEQ